MKFEEYEDQLFRMLEKSEPLTEDTKLPVLVQLIQDDTMLGKANKRSCHPDTLAEKRICSYLTDDGLFFDGNYTYRYEIIGYPVEEGSAEWALYQMMQGEKICHHKSPSIVYCKHAGDRIRRQVRYNCVDYMSIDAWLLAIAIKYDGADRNGWQFYEPKLEQPKYKVGDWVELNNNHQGQIKKMFPAGMGELCGTRIHRTEPTFLITGLSGEFHYDTITRKLSPSEVIVHIGCLSGIIEDLSYAEDGRFWFIGGKTERRPVGMYAILYDEMLDTQTRELVESLLEAQEEEK